MRAALCLSAVLALAAAAPSVPHVALDAKVVDAQEAIINHANSVQSVRSGGFSPRGELEGTLASCGGFFCFVLSMGFFRCVATRLLPSRNARPNSVNVGMASAVPPRGRF
jgi:hypothetical protein